MLIFWRSEAASDRRSEIIRRLFQRGVWGVIGLLSIGVCSLSAQADEIFTDRAAFESSLGTFRVFTFEPNQGFSIGLLPSFDGGRIQTRSELGAYFGPASIIGYGDTANQVLVGNEVAGPHPNSNVRLLFSEPQFALGFDSIGARETVVVDVTYLDSSASQYIFDAGDVNPRPFFGLISEVGFRDVFIMGANRDDPNNPGEQPNHIDNLTLIPEPGSAALFVVGGLTLMIGLRGRAGRAGVA